MDLKDDLPAPLKATCPECKAGIDVRTHALARFVVCAGCRSSFLFDAADGALRSKRRYKSAGMSRYLEPGDEGTISGRRYLVTGWIAKKESGTSFLWCEYYLFNPVHGFAQLSVFQGHWTFHEQLRVYPRDTNINQTLIFQRNVYEPFNRYACKVIEAVGEFTGDINAQERASVSELISPPYMLTRELDGDELAWYLGRYMEPEDVRKAFAKPAAPPARSGVGACQPMALAIDKSTLRMLSIGFAIVMLITLIAIRVADGPKTVLDQTIMVAGNGPTGEPGATESGDFHLDRFRNSVELFAQADQVDNSWAEVSGAMINNATGETRSFLLSIEYYHGYTGGENWSEGKNNQGIVFSALPAGDYHLELYTASDPLRRVDRVAVRVEQHATLWSNLLILLLVGLAFPLFIWWRVERFETARWGE